jgi:hypothetical protein
MQLWCRKRKKTFIKTIEYLQCKYLFFFRFLVATTNKFNLVLSNDYETQESEKKTFWIDRFDEIMKLERRFQSFDVTFDERRYETSLKMFSQITLKSAPIKRLVLRNVEFESPNDFLNMMKQMTSLEELELSKVTFKAKEAETNQAKRPKLAEVEPVLMKILETIILCGSDSKFLSYLTAPKTASLKVASFKGETLRDNLVNFMMPLKHLQAVDLDCITHWDLFSAPFPGKPLFKLTKWKTIDKTFHVISDELITFLRPHLPTLKELEIDGVKKEFLLKILQKNRHLNRLNLYVDIPSNVEFFRGLIPFPQVKELILRGDAKTAESTKAFLSLFPNLDKLKVSTYQDNAMICSLLPFINQINPELKSLAIREIIDNSAVKLKCLESLRVKDVNDPKALIVFLMNNPTIETLCVSFLWNKKFQTILKLLLDKTNVKHLQLTGELDTMKAIFDKIKVDYKNLKTLQLTIYIGTDDDIPVRKFEFPEDRNQWDSNRSNDFDGIVSLPYHQWENILPEDNEELLEDLRLWNFLMDENQLPNIDDEFNIADEDLNENDRDMNGQQ